MTLPDPKPGTPVPGMLEPRTPESLTRLERAWLKRRYCAWCEAPVHVNACYSMYGKHCSDRHLNARRGRWLAEDYRPRAAIASAKP